MKASTFLSLICNHSRQLALAGILVFSFLLSRPAPAQYAYIPGSAGLNVYFANNGSIFAGEFDPTPDLFSGPCTQVDPANLNIGSEFTPPSFFSSALPGNIGPGTFPTYNPGAMGLGTASALVNYFPSPGLTYSNALGQSSAAPFGANLTLINTGPGIAELRLDWTAQFNYSGSTPIAASVDGIVSVDLGTWVAVAGGITFYDVTTISASPGTSVSTAIIGNSGDFAISFPPGLHSGSPPYSPSGTFWGLKSPPSPSGFQTGFLGGTGATINPSSGDVIETVGFIDLLVDPGSMQLSITPAPVPQFHSAHASGTNLLVNVQNGVAGVSYVTCRSTDASAPLNTWLPVATNIPSSTGNFNFTATNAVDPTEKAAFFVIRAQ
jgi:hypothetical protein